MIIKSQISVSLNFIFYVITLFLTNPHSEIEKEILRGKPNPFS